MMAKSTFGQKDMFGNDWDKNLNSTVKATLNHIKNLEDKIAKLESE